MPIKSNGPLSIGPGYQQRGIASFWDYGDTGNYVHIKTSIPQQTYVMPMIEIIGYAYGYASPVRLAFVIYTYSYLISNYQNAYFGLQGNGVYISSDGYVCLRMFAMSTYFMGFSIDAYSVAGAGAGYEVGILAMTISTNSGNVY